MSKQKEKPTTRLIKGGIFIPIKIGDIILRGKFRNRRTRVKTIEIDEHGMPLINGKPITNFRFYGEIE